MMTTALASSSTSCGGDMLLDLQTRPDRASRRVPGELAQVTFTALRHWPGSRRSSCSGRITSVHESEQEVEK